MAKLADLTGVYEIYGTPAFDQLGAHSNGRWGTGEGYSPTALRFHEPVRVAVLHSGASLIVAAEREHDLHCNGAGWFGGTLESHDDVRQRVVFVGSSTWTQYSPPTAQTNDDGLMVFGIDWPPFSVHGDFAYREQLGLELRPPSVSAVPGPFVGFFHAAMPYGGFNDHDDQASAYARVSMLPSESELRRDFPQLQ